MDTENDEDFCLFNAILIGFEGQNENDLLGDFKSVDFFKRLKKFFLAFFYFFADSTHFFGLF